MSALSPLDEKITELLATILQVDKGQISEQSNVDNLKNWDSVNHMHLVVALEEEFGVEFQDDEAVQLISYELIRSYLREKLRNDR